MVFSYFKHARRRKLLNQPFPESWLNVLTRNVGLYSRLPEPLRVRLREKTRVLVAELSWEGTKGFAVTDEMKVTVAGQAALLLLGNDDYYFERVTAIVLHPKRIIKRSQPVMLAATLPPLLQEAETELLGEAWRAGSIVLSWPAALEGGRNAGDGQNLVLHELAHHLDGLDGEMGGSPPLPADQLRHWNEVTQQAMQQFADECAAGGDTLLDPYGLTNAAEFFAVVTETFFECGRELRRQYPDLYAAYRGFYRVDPAEWHARPADIGAIAAEPAVIHWNGDDEDEPDGYEAAPVLPPLETADRYFTRGIDLFEDANFSAAEQDFDRAVRLQPNDQEALLYRALCRLFLGHDEAALADADRACRLDPSDNEALRVRGMCRVALADFENGLSDLNAAERIDDLNADALFYRGVAYAELQQWRKAIDDLSRVLKLDPSDAEAYRERSRCYEMLGDHAAAQRDRQQLSRLGSDPLGADM